MERKRQTRHRGIALQAAVMMATPFLAGNGVASEPTVAGPSFAQIGLLLEQARPVESSLVVDWESTELQLESLVDSKAQAPHRSVPHWLSAELRYVQQNFEAAADEFRKAAKDSRRTSFEDDAAFAAIEALQASGDDVKAAKEWVKWQKKYPKSALAGEARLSRLWNAIRRHAVEEAFGIQASIQDEFAWLMDDARAKRALASLAFTDGNFERALEILAVDTTPSAGYLRAMCHDAMGAGLKAAAEYQEVAARTTSQTLRDHAAFNKAHTFFKTEAYRSAAEEFDVVAQTAAQFELRSEAALRAAAARMLEGEQDNALSQFDAILTDFPETSAAGRAQFLIGEIHYGAERFEDAIAHFNRVLEHHFEQSLAATAQYRVARSLDALGRSSEATASYQAVVSGYSLEREAPAAAYLAGVGLLSQAAPQVAASYFQLVLDRYANQQGETQTYVFESTSHQELVEAALCLQLLSYHRAGDLGQMSGVPHLALQRMPASQSPWRAYAMLIDADALASQGRYDEAQAALEQLVQHFPGQDVSLRAHSLLAWTYAQQGELDLAIAEQEKLLRRASSGGDVAQVSDAYLNRAHVLFNRKEYKKSAVAYEEFLNRFGSHPKRSEALYQVGLVYVRLDQNGDAVDRWETLVAEAPATEVAEKAWMRAGDLYFRAGRYDDAKRSFGGLLQNFESSNKRAEAMLRLAQCEYNAGQDDAALQAYAQVIASYPGSSVAQEAESGMQQSLYRLGSAADGVEVLAELVERFPTSSFAADAQLRVARLHHEKGRFAEAAEAFRRVVSQFPSFSAAHEAHFLMADSYERAGNPDAAQRAYEQFTIFFPADDLLPTARFRLASLHFASEQFARASVGFMQVYEQDEDDDLKRASLFNLALCRKQLNDVVQAEQLLEQYLKGYPKDERVAETAFHLGDLQERAGRTDQAVTQYERALAARPQKELTPQLHFRLGACHETLGASKAALSHYKTARAHPVKADPFRLSAVVRLAAIFEDKAQYKSALGAYKDLIRHAGDQELVAVATERVAQLEQALQ